MRPVKIPIINFISLEDADFSSPDNLPMEIVKLIKSGLFRGKIFPTPVILLNSESQDRYKVICIEARNIFDAARTEARRVHDIDYNAAWNVFMTAVYDDYVDKLHKYNAARTSIRQAFDDTCKKARMKYEDICDAAFWDLFATSENRADAWK